MQRRNLTALLLLLVVVGIGATACGYSAPAEGEGDEPAKVEAIEDSDVSKVVLTEDAARRIGLETGAVALSNVDSDVVVRGLVAADPAAAGSFLVHVSLPATELAQVDVSRAARVLAVFGSDGVVAPLVGHAASGGTLTYRLDGAGRIVHAGQRVRVEVALTGSGQQKTIPYSAVIYGVEGGTWTYTSAGPLTFIRAPITVAAVEGDVAILSDGPDPGTEVVTVGGEELLGTEFAIEGE
jgi:hypothetical protein